MGKGAKASIPLFLLLLIACKTTTFRCLEGDCVSSGTMLHGITGDVYKGEMKNGKPHGYGTMIYGIGNYGYTSSSMDGDVYTGYWVYDGSYFYPQGEGRLTRPYWDVVMTGIFEKGFLVFSPGTIETLQGEVLVGYWYDYVLHTGECGEKLKGLAARGISREKIGGFLNGVCQVWHRGKIRTLRYLDGKRDWQE